MHINTNRAVGFSFSLHLALAALLALVRAGVPLSPNAVMVDWIENMPSLGSDEVTASPKQGVATRPVIKTAKPAPAQTQSGLKPMAEAAPAAGLNSTEVKARQMSAEEFYRASVRQTLEQRKVYPPLARRLGQTGTVVLKFILGKNGALLNSELTSASPYPVLNEAAKTLLASAKFQPIPDELKSPSWEFTIPIEYRLD